MFIATLGEEEEECDDNEDAEDEEAEESGEDDALEQVVILHLHNSHLIEDVIYLCLRSRDIYVGDVCNYISKNN